MTKRRSSLALRMLGGALAVLAATLLGVAASGVSYALFNAERDIAPGEVRSGTAAIEVEGGLDPIAWSNLVAGESVGQQVTVRNTGTTPLRLRAEGSAAVGYELRAARGGCESPGSPIGGVPADLGRLAPGEAAAVCVRLDVTPTAVPGASVDVAVAFTGESVRS